MTVKAEIKQALRSGEASYKIEENNKKYVLSVKEGCSLIHTLDGLFGSGVLGQVPSAQISGNDAIPSINIDGYLLSPSVFKSQKIIKNGYHIYNFDYIAPKNS